MSNDEKRILLLELPDLAISPPLSVAITSALQTCLGNPIEPAVRIEVRGDLVGNGFVVDKPVVVGRTDGLLIKPHRVRIAPFDARDLPRDQQCSVVEILGAVPGPHLELLMMRTDRFEVLT